jgi:hypothetical protein
MGSSFMSFDFLTRAENGALSVIYGAFLDWTSCVKNSLDRDRVYVYSLWESTGGERADRICDVLCRAMMMENDAGRDALIRVIQARNRGLSDEEFASASNQIWKWGKTNRAHYTEYYDEYSKQSDGSPRYDRSEHHWWINQSANTSITVAIRHLDAINKLTPKSEPLESLTNAEAASVFFEITRTPYDLSRISREIKQGKIAKTDDGRITRFNVTERAWAIDDKRKNREQSKSPTVNETICPQCKQPTHKLHGAAKVCMACFHKNLSVE